MSDRPAVVSSADEPGGARRRIRGLLLLLAALIVVERLHTFDEPPHPDLDFYAVMGHELLAGRSLYSDLWDDRPPAGNATYAAAELLAGRGPVQRFLLSVAAAVLTLFGVHAAASRAGPAAGLLAALFWALLCGDLRLEANQPNVEVFMNAARVWAFAVWVRADQPSARRASFAGLLVAAGSFYKQFLLVDALAFALAHAAAASSIGRRRALREIAPLIGGCALAWSALILYFVATGRIGVFVDAIVRHGRGYALQNAPAGAGLVGNVLEGLGWSRLVPDRMRFAAPMAAMSLVAIVTLGRRAPRAAALLLAWLAATEIAVALPGRFYIHYYQLWLPPLAIGAAWGIVACVRLPRIGRPLGGVVACALTLLLLRREAYAYAVPGALWSERKYPGRILDLEEVGADVESLLEPGETFYELGNEVGLYRVTGRPPPTGVLYLTHHLTSGPLAAMLCERVVADLERARPELLVSPTVVLERLDPSHPVLRYGVAHYRPLRRARGGAFMLLVRRGGRLDRTTAGGAVENPRGMGEGGSVR